MFAARNFERNKNVNRCTRCGRKGKQLILCMACELFINKQTLPGVKPEAVARAKDYVRTTAMKRLGKRNAFAAPSTSKRSMVGRIYKASEQQCTCPSGIYRGLHGAACKHSFAVQLLNKRSNR